MKERFFDDVKDDIIYQINKAKQAPKIFEVWEIDDGHKYPTELHAKIALQIHKKGYLFVDTITSDRLLADRLEELISMGIVKHEKQDGEKIFLSISEPPKWRDKAIDIDDNVDMVENVFAKYKPSDKPQKAIRDLFNTSHPK